MLSVIEIYSFLYFIFYQLFLFVFKLLGPLLLKVKPKWQAQVAQGIIKEDLSTTMQVDALPWLDNWRQHWTEIHLYGLKCGLFGIALHLSGRARMHVVVPRSTEQDCVVLDSVAISCSGLDGTGLGWAVRIALLCTALDWTRLDCHWLIWTWATLDWNVLSWKGMNWNWTGTNRIGLDGTGLDGRRFHWMDWTTRQWSGLDWTEPDSTSEDWIGLS